MLTEQTEYDIHPPRHHAIADMVPEKPADTAESNSRPQSPLPQAERHG